MDVKSHKYIFFNILGSKTNLRENLVPLMQIKQYTVQNYLICHVVLFYKKEFSLTLTYV